MNETQKPQYLKAFAPLIISIALLLVQTPIFFFIPDVIREFFYNNNAYSPAESMLLASYYSIVFTAILSIIISVITLPAYLISFVKMLKTKNNGLRVKQTIQVFCCSIFFYIFAVAITPFGVFENQKIDDVKGFYSDYQEIKSQNLNKTEVFLFRVNETNATKFFKFTETYTCDVMTAYAYPQTEEMPDSIGYYLPWKNDVKVQTDYIFRGTPEENNQNSTVYELTHTSYHRVVTKIS